MKGEQERVLECRGKNHLEVRFPARREVFQSNDLLMSSCLLSMKMERPFQESSQGSRIHSPLPIIRTLQSQALHKAAQTPLPMPDATRWWVGWKISRPQLRLHSREAKPIRHEHQPSAVLPAPPPPPECKTSSHAGRRERETKDQDGA